MTMKLFVVVVVAVVAVVFFLLPLKIDVILCNLSFESQKLFCYNKLDIQMRTKLPFFLTLK